MRNKAASGVATRGNNVAAVIAQLLTKVLPSASRSPPSASESASDDGFYYYSDEKALAEQPSASPPLFAAAAPLWTKPSPTPIPPALPPAPPPLLPTKLKRPPPVCRLANDAAQLLCIGEVAPWLAR